MMSVKEFQENYQTFSELINHIHHSKDEQLDTLIKRYVEQNLVIMNDVFTTSIENLKRLQKAQAPNDIICIQARFTNEISKKLTLSAQRFLNASLGHIADYNEWLRAHCDLATD
jgi:EAL domain-containing protein (putative c-di-GMP-specific phosphodiesterase class I)